eukprot:1192466-Prorocentrum_minimum.AAC.3
MEGYIRPAVLLGGGALVVGAMMIPRIAEICWIGYRHRQDKKELQAAYAGLDSIDSRDLEDVITTVMRGREDAGNIEFLDELMNYQEVMVNTVDPFYDGVVDWRLFEQYAVALAVLRTVKVPPRWRYDQAWRRHFDCLGDYLWHVAVGLATTELQRRSDTIPNAARLLHGIDVGTVIQRLFQRSWRWCCWYGYVVALRGCPQREILPILLVIFAHLHI